jgi:hypothetical protein
VAAFDAVFGVIPTPRSERLSERSPPVEPPHPFLKTGLRLRVRFVDSSQLGAPISDAPYTFF